MGDIKEFTPKKDDDNPSPLLVRKYVSYENRGCDHKKGTLHIDAEARTVECSACKEVVDPIQALLALADKAHWRRRCDAEVVELEAKKAAKLKGVALQTLIRFGVTPEKYRECYLDATGKVTP